VLQNLDSMPEHFFVLNGDVMVVAPIQMNWKRIRRKDHLLSCVLALRARGVWESDQAEGRGASGGGKESASVGY
jgi:hypothetical protein